MLSPTQKPLAIYVEDNEQDQELLTLALMKSDNKFDVQFINDGQSAIKYIDEILAIKGSDHYPQLFLLDIAMPGVDGWDVLKYFRSEKKLGHVPVVVFSTSNSKRDMDESIRLGANAYITKPMNMKDFVSELETTLTHWLEVASVKKLL